MKLRSLALSLVVAPVVFTSSLAFSQGSVERLEPLNATIATFEVFISST